MPLPARDARGFYAWQRRPESAHARRDRQLRVLVRTAHEAGIVARPRPRFRTTTMSDHDQRVAANVTDRQFTADAPNQRWVGDTSEFLVGGGTKLFVAAILDLYSRIRGRLGGECGQRSAPHDQGTRDGHRAPVSRARLLNHSDQGCTYASEDYQRRLTNHGITCSLSRRGNCYDNGVMESFFFSTVKVRARREL